MIKIVWITIFNGFQVQLSERTSLLESAEAKIAELTAKVNEQQKLIQKLEDDILKVCSQFLSPLLSVCMFNFS